MRFKTPLTLNEAIQNGIYLVIELPCNQLVTKAGAKLIEDHVRDFLAQRFGASYLKASGNDETLALLEDLFSKIIAQIPEEQGELNESADG